MAPKKTELKVTINCNKCKTQVLKAIAKLSGVDLVSVDSQKGIVTVIGEVDPVCVTTKIRRTGKVAEIISVGPPKNPDPAPPKNPDPAPPKNTNPANKPGKPEPDPKPLPPCCPQCQVIAIGYDPYDRICSIL